MKVELNKVVAVGFKLFITNNVEKPQLVEEVDDTNPMYFLVGNSGLPPKFEFNLMGKSKGDTFNFSITSAEGFGNYDFNEIMNLPIDDFLDADGKLDKQVFQVGRSIPMQDEHGHHVRGRILEIKEFERYIRMDFNHPLAGKDLQFEGIVLSVREATKEEISHGHVHGDGGHHH
ncbi:MAG: FKBP-type peptidyl-prolyl cis-trans isomerase [Bacteroidota bacterium]|nr:FKBP-type peptidyl-prolyl cis-trans isomerase [Bacteroidota bacterium]